MWVLVGRSDLGCLGCGVDQQDVPVALFSSEKLALEYISKAKRKCKRQLGHRPFKKDSLLGPFDYALVELEAALPIDPKIK